VSHTVNVLCFPDRKGRVFSDEYLEFIPIGLLDSESNGSCVRVANRSEWKRDVYGEVVETHAWMGTPFTCGG